MPKAIIKKVEFGTDAEKEMWKYVRDNVEYWLARTKNFRETTLKKYARLYKGTPLNEVKNTPWPNAANNVIQVIATASDQLLSRVMGIYMTDPLWAFKICGELAGEDVDEQRGILEEFMQDQAISSSELDLYRVEQTWFSSAIRNGTGILEFPWQYYVEQQIASQEGIDGNNISNFTDFIKYDGPKPETVPLNKFVNNLNFSRLEDSNFKFKIVTLNKFQLAERKELNVYNSAKIDKILATPDRTQPDILQQYLLTTQGINEDVPSEGNCGASYDLIECWFKYWHNGKKYSLVAHLHMKSQTDLLAFYNFYPDNIEPYEDARLAYDDDQWLGYGFAEMLNGYQDEISIGHNQRTDAGTLNNTTAFRINKNSKLHSTLTFYPGILIPADENEIERLDTSNQFAVDSSQEQLTNAYCKERSGIDPAIGGTGGGVVNPKRGIYSSQGTFAVLQQQNNRNSLRTSDMRSAHTRAGVKLLKMYTHFGIGSKLSQYGDRADLLKKAFANVRAKKLGILMRPASASVNKEMEKQNDIFMSQILEKYYQGNAQIIQGITSGQMPPELKQYYIDVMKATASWMKHTLRNFGYDDISRLIPTPDFLQENNNGTSNGVRSAQASSGISAGSSGTGGTGGVQTLAAEQGGDAPTLPVSSMEDSDRVPS